MASPPIDESAPAVASARRSRRPASVLPSWSPKLAVGLIIVGITVAWAVIGPFVVADPNAISTDYMAHPSLAHWLGTTETGEDVWAQIAWGIRGSLIIGFVVGAIATVLSTVFGIVGAYIGGIIDESFALFTNVVLVIPGLPLVMVIGNYVPARARGLLLVAIVLAVTSWAGSARVLRAVTLSLRNRDYVSASRVSGERTWRILAAEILPNLVPVLASQFVFAIIFAILGEAGLSFLGLGASNTFTLGTILSQAYSSGALTQGAWWWFIPPGLVIAAFGAALSLINFSIDEIINPKLRTGTRAQQRTWRAYRPAARSAREAARESRPAADQAAPVGPPAQQRSADPVLTVEDFSIDYLGETTTHAVKHVDLALSRGEILGLAGESGCGKSTLAYGITRLLKPPALVTSGHVTFHPAAGPVVEMATLYGDELRAFRWEKISMVFQGAMNSLNPVVTIQAQMEDIFTAHRPEMPKRERVQRCGELLERVGVPRSRLKSFAHELSGGMRQRVMIAMAMALEPQVMIMDEPTTALDVVVQREILDEITRLRSEVGFAVIFITHDLPLLLEISDRIAVMKSGEIVELNSAYELYTNPQHDYTRQLLGSFPSLTGQRGDFIRTGALDFALDETDQEVDA